MACDHGVMLMSDHDDAYVDAMLMVNMQANTRSVTELIRKCTDIGEHFTRDVIQSIVFIFLPLGESTNLVYYY